MTSTGAGGCSGGGPRPVALDEVLRKAFPTLVADLSSTFGDTTSGPDRWPEVRDEVVRRLLASPRRLGRDIPALAALGDRPLPYGSFKHRTANSLRRGQVRTWKDLADLSTVSIQTIRQAGRLTATDVATVCADLAVRTASATLGTATEDGPLAESESESSHDERWTEVAGVLADIDRWRATERPEAELADVVQLAPELVPPPELAARMRDALDPMRSTTVPAPSADDLVAAWFDDLDDRVVEIYRRRVLSRPADTLQVIADDLGLTRERIRQLQHGAMVRTDDRLSRAEFEPLRWRAADLVATLGPIAPLGHPSAASALAHATRDVDPERLEAGRHLIIEVAAGYERSGGSWDEGWLVASGRSVPEVADLATLFDEFGIASADAVDDALDAAGLGASFHRTWLDRQPTLRRLGSVVARWEPDMASKAVAVLAVVGEPMTPEELVAHAGGDRSVRSMKNALAVHPAAIRTGPRTWGLRVFGLDEYSSTAAEIAEELTRRGGGPAPLEDVVATVTARFDLRPGSVRSFAGAPMFVVEDGMIRFRGSQEPYLVSGDISGIGGAFRPTRDLVVASIPVDRDVRRGSGRGLPEGLGVALGVRPGVGRDFAGAHGALRVRWPLSSFTGPSLGSLRVVADAVGAVDGDRVALHFDLHAATVTPHRLPADWAASLDAKIALFTMTGLEPGPDLDGALARAVGTSVALLDLTMATRGEGAILALARSLTR